MKCLNFFVVLVWIMTLVLPHAGWAGEAKQGEDVTKLGVVVVTATRTPHLHEDVPVETVVITKEDIEKSNAQTISDLLSSVPGIFVRAEDIPGASGWRTKVRGLDINSGYGLVLIDGQRVKGGGMGEYGIGLNQIPLEMIERIEIVKGPSSVLYGSDALAGVVNIITKSPPETPRYGFEVASGTHNVWIGDIWFGGKIGKLGVQINADHEESECGKYGYRSNRREDYYRDRLDAKFSYDLAEDVKLSLGINLEDWDRARKYESGVKRYTDKKKYRVSPGLEAGFEDGSILKVRGYWYDWDFDSKECGGASGFTPLRGDIYYRQGEFQYTKPLTKIHIVTLGSEYLEEELDYSLAHETIKTKSFYFQDEMNFLLWKPFTVILGGRFDDHSGFGSEFCPKLSFMLEATQKTRVRASVGRGFKSPTIRQLYYETPFQHGDHWIRSNPDLDAEYSVGYSMGIEQRFGEKSVLGLTLFRNDLRDKVTSVETDDVLEDLPVNTYRNVEDAHTQGVEISFKAEIFSCLSAVFGYTYLDTEDEETNKNLTYSPENTFSVRLTYDYNPWGLNIGIGTEYVDKMYKNSQNTKETDDYFLTEAKLIKKLAEYATISVEANNIFDSDYGDPESQWAGPTFLTRLKFSF